MKHLRQALAETSAEQLRQIYRLWGMSKESKNKLKAVEEQVMMLYPFAESTTALYAVGRELFSTVAKRAEMTLEQIVTTLPQGELALIVQRYGLAWDQYAYRNELREAII